MQDLRKIVLVRRVEQGFGAACCEPAKRSAHARADPPCKGNVVREILRKSSDAVACEVSLSH